MGNHRIKILLPSVVDKDSNGFPVGDGICAIMGDNKQLIKIKFKIYFNITIGL